MCVYTRRIFCMSTLEFAAAYLNLQRLIFLFAEPVFHVRRPIFPICGGLFLCWIASDYICRGNSSSVRLCLLRPFLCFYFFPLRLLISCTLFAVGRPLLWALCYLLWALYYLLTPAWIHCGGHFFVVDITLSFDSRMNSLLGASRCCQLTLFAWLRFYVNLVNTFAWMCRSPITNLAWSNFGVSRTHIPFTRQLESFSTGSQFLHWWARAFGSGYTAEWKLPWIHYAF